MIGIKIAGEFVELYPGTQIQRERNSPFFLVKNSDGKDGLGSEFAFPFLLPASDKNLRLYQYPDMLQSVKKKSFDAILYNDGMQLSYGKQIIDNIKANLSKANVGSIDTHFYSNSSEFFQRVKTKKLRELELGGARNFAWAGFNKLVPGFWKHVHDTWAYDDSDDGDYVFFSVYNPGYTGTAEWMNKLRYYVDTASPDVEIDRQNNVVSLCPSIYVKYVLTKIFEENGYTLSGALLDDADFKKLTMLSFYGVYWSEIVFPEVEEGEELPEDAALIPTPLANITIRLAEHMPPVITCSEFLVELCKFLPIGFDINDNSRTATVKWLQKLNKAGAKDRTANFRPSYGLKLGEGESLTKIFGIKRNIHFSDSYTLQMANLETGIFDGYVVDTPNSIGTPKQVKLKISTNEYYYLPGPGPTGSGWLKFGNNNGGYEPTGATDYIDSNISPLPLERILHTEMFEGITPIRRPPYIYLPYCNVEGNWFSKSGNTTEWGLRFMFYRGKNNPVDNFKLAPWATNSVYKWQMEGGGQYKPTLLDGLWSLCYDTSDYGLIKLWKPWLDMLGQNEVLSGILNMPLQEYLQLKWSDVLLIDNTPYLLTKIKEILSYQGHIDIEAIRMV